MGSVRSTTRSLQRFASRGRSVRARSGSLAASLTVLTAIGLAACGSTPSSAATTTSTSTTTDSSSPHTLSTGDHTITLSSGGRVRSLILHIPPGNAVANRPLILVFHGADDTAANTVKETDFEKIANKDGELVAFLQGYKDTWNEGAGHTPAEQAKINDVAFTQAAIAKIETLVSFDHKRVVATGFSNGALMVEDLGCKLANELVLIVPVEGQLPTSVSKTCAPARPISVYEIHATGDGSIPYNGGSFAGVGGGTVVLSAPKSAARWAKLDVCSSKAEVTYPVRNIKLSTYTGCHAKVTVVLRTIEGGSHQWGSNIGELVTAALPPVS
jgi:polyhydroxybutyrate depolymerase